jgi:hypothetical protein
MSARVLEALGPIGKLDDDELGRRLHEVAPYDAELVSSLRDLVQSSPRNAKRLATVYAASLPEVDQHRQVFQAAAGADEQTRRTLIGGYRVAGQAQWIVHAIGQLPAAQARTVMGDFVLTPAGRKDREALAEVTEYLAHMGKAMYASKHAPDDGTHDAAVVDLVEDVADSVKQAVTSVVDAVEQVVGDIGSAIASAVDWATDKVVALARALLEAGKSILDCIQGALSAVTPCSKCSAP